MELKEVAEVTYKTVYKKVNRKGQEENLLAGEVSEVTEEVKQDTPVQNNDSLTVELIHNNEKNGIELKFNGKPSEGTRELLKENGFRWSKFSKVWYIKQSEKALLFAESFVSAFNDIVIDEITEVEEVEVVSNPITDQTIQPEEVEPITETENNPYNNEVVETVNGFYCHFKAWNMEVNEIESMLQSANIPYSLGCEKFFFIGITVDQFATVQHINKVNESILFDDSFDCEHVEPITEQQSKDITEDNNSNDITEPTKQNDPITATEKNHGKVLDFNSKLKAKQEKDQRQKETESMTNHFIDNVLPYLNNDEIAELQKIYNSKDEKELDILWKRLMMITAVRRAKEEVLKQN
jgi:hypothetical protein